MPPTFRQFPIVLAVVFSAGILNACQSQPALTAGDPGAISSVSDAASDAPSNTGAQQTEPESSKATSYRPTSDTCEAGEAVRVWAMPLAPRSGDPLKIVAVATDAALGQLYVTGPDGNTRPLPVDSAGGPPWSLHGIINRPEAGTYRVDALRGSQVAACAEMTIDGGPGDRGSGDWDLPARALYAVWVERLFDDPPEQSLNFASLAPVLADPRRNFLHNYLAATDDNGLVLEPDCADLSYILRAYFAWKLGLPLSYRACNRGSASSPPRCDAPLVDGTLAGTPASAGTFSTLSRQIMNTVHSGSGRTALADEATDYYPLPLQRSALWPGTLYADPYGHTMVIVKWVPQTPSRGGMLLAVDAQPDNSVSRKRFWEGTFLFADTPSAGPGFKTARPLVRSGNAWQPASNTELSGAARAQPYSGEQAMLSADDFYARMERLINPSGLDPASAYEETLTALMEQLRTRVGSVDRGEAYMAKQGGQVMSMPQGGAIFETTGPWEDYATPSRDMRLLIAMKVLEGLPERVRRYPELYRLRGESPDQAAARIRALHAQRIEERTIEYSRTDGSPWRLSVAEIYARRSALEAAYNPNDCVEQRWGAAPDSQENATCARRAPPDQQARMESYRPWFRDTRRPSR